MKSESYLKLKNVFKQTLFISFPLFLFSSFLIGTPILTNKYSVETIDIDYAEIKIVGKQSDPMIRIIEGRNIISGDCHESLGKLCHKYQYKSLFGEQNKIIILNNKYSILLHSNLTDENGKKILIRNFNKKDEIIEKFINRKKFFPKIFLFFSASALVGFFIVNLLNNRNAGK